MSDKALIRQIKTLYSQIEEDSKASLSRCIELGSILAEQKKKLGHGNFVAWVDATLPFSSRSSRNYLSLFSNKDKIKEANITTLNEAYHFIKLSRPFALYRNDYDRPEKNSTVYTPPKVSNYLYKILSSVVSPHVIIDAGIGKGSLSVLWRKKGAKIIGVDVDPVGKKCSDVFIQSKFEDLHKWDYDFPDLVLCNPPFNGHKPVLYPELFLRKMSELFGEKIGVVLFVPIGFRLNVKISSARWQWLMNSKYKITSIVSLPVDCFGLISHSEILFFNIPRLKPHYFLGE